MIKPVNKRILVIPHDIAEKTDSDLLFLPPNAQSPEKARRGEVVSVGKGVDLEVEGKYSSPYVSVKPNDTIIFGRHSGVEVIQDGQTYLIMSPGDILAVVEEEQDNDNRK